MACYPHVALIVETAKQYDRGVLRGIGRYIKGHGPWSVYLEERGPQDVIPSWLTVWRGDGIIARIKDVPMAEALQEQDDVARWLAELPHPVGVLACNDIRGLQVLDACRRIDLSVPEGVAVLGVDNDEVLCALSDPPLSSIDQDLERIGYEAAALLDRLMAGEVSNTDPILIEPLGVVARLSTDSVAIDHPAVATAFRVIRQYACDNKGVDYLADRTGLSRRALQRRLKALTGRTLQEEILNTQLARVRQMLAETDLKLESIARKSGFNYAGYMCCYFKKKTGMTPGEYRRLHSRELPRPTR